MTVARTKIVLPKVEPFFPAEMADAARRVDKVLSQLAHDASVINADGAAGLAAHLADHANPHVVTKAQVGLSLVENTALSTWAGSANITTLGTIGTGTWNATAIAWAKVDKSGSSLADLATRSAADLSSGVLANARVQQSNVTQHQAALAIAYTQLTYSGLTAGQVLRATAAGTAAFGALDLANASAVTGLLPWANVNKTGSSLADLTTRSAADLSSGVLVDARVQQSNVTQHQAALAIAYSQLTGVVPTWNQNTTGSAAKWTTARNLAGNSVDGSAHVAFANKFIVQGTADAGLSAAQFLGALGTGIVKNTTATGVLSIAVAGDFPTLNQNTTGSAATLTTPRMIWGQNFNGSADVSGALSAATTGDFSGEVTAARSRVNGSGTGSLFRGFDATTYAAMAFGAVGSTVHGYIGVDKIGTLVTGTATGDMVFRAENKSIYFSVDAGSTTVGKFSPTAFTLAGDLLFTDATYDIGKSGATRPRDGFFSRNLRAGGTGIFDGGAAFGGATSQNSISVSLPSPGYVFFGTEYAFYGDSASAVFRTPSGGTIYFRAGVTDAATLTSSVMTLAADLKFTDATYDIGKSGATRPRDGFFSRNLTVGGSYTSGTPSGGTAQPWKFGSVITGEVGLALNTTSHVQLDVNGTLVKLALIL